MAARHRFNISATQVAVLPWRYAEEIGFANSLYASA